MVKQIDNNVKQSLLAEINLAMRYYFRQNISDIMNDLHCQSRSFSNTDRIDTILRTIYQSGVLYQHSDKILVQLRKAVNRFVQGELGYCPECGGEISVSQLTKAPTGELCENCIMKRYAYNLQRAGSNC
jgi:RNA polymerase-binding transcription factor DksA